MYSFFTISARKNKKVSIGITTGIGCLNPFVAVDWLSTPKFAAMQKSKLGHFRTVAIIEGISYLFLLFIAMPLKYMADLPEAVRYTGWVNGLIFVAYCFLLLLVWIAYKWSFKKTTLVFISSLIPFAPFFVDKTLKAEDR